MDVYQRRRLVALSAIAAIFIVFVLLIRSCGGDDEPTTPTPVAGATGLGGTEQSQASYIDQADPICLGANDSIAGVDTSAPTANEDLAEIISTELEGLQSLPAPDEGADDLDDFLSALDDQISAYEDKATAVERGDDASVAEIDATLDQAATDAADAADAFGFQVCGDRSEVSGSGGNNDTDDTGDVTTTEDTSGGTVTPTTTTPVAPPTTTPVAPPADTGTETAPPSDTGSDTGSGGVSP
jgi:hypothetical protein